jgi:ribonuclease P protein component
VIARDYRLQREGDVRRVRSRGKAAAHGPLVARILPNELDPPHNRYTVIAGKRCGKAVQRNRLKRLAREALRGYHPWLAAGHDVVVICRGTVEELPSLTVAQEALARIFTRAGLWTIPPGSPGGPPAPGEPVTTGWGTPARTPSSPSEPHP